MLCPLVGQTIDLLNKDNSTHGPRTAGLSIFNLSFHSVSLNTLGAICYKSLVLSIDLIAAISRLSASARRRGPRSAGSRPLFACCLELRKVIVSASLMLLRFKLLCTGTVPLYIAHRNPSYRVIASKDRGRRQQPYLHVKSSQG